MPQKHESPVDTMLLILVAFLSYNERTIRERAIQHSTNEIIVAYTTNGLKQGIVTA